MKGKENALRVGRARRAFCKKYIKDMPEDAYGTQYRIGGWAVSPTRGAGRVMGVAVGADGSVCLVCSFHRHVSGEGKYASRWRTWLVRASDAVAMDEYVGPETGKTASANSEEAR